MMDIDTLLYALIPTRWLLTLFGAVFFPLWAFIDLIRSQAVSQRGKIAWASGLVIFPFGSLAYGFYGSRARTTKRLAFAAMISLIIAALLHFYVPTLLPQAEISAILKVIEEEEK